MDSLTTKPQYYRLFLALLFAIIANLPSLHAQSISGIVVDSHHVPVEFVNIMVSNPVDSVLVTGSVSSGTGEFNIDKLSEGEYLLQFSCIGYATKWLSVAVDASVHSYIGKIVLDEDPNLLNEIIIEASLPPFSRKGNNMIAYVSASLLSSAGTANDVIKQFPGVSVKDKTITVFGKGSPVIYINNRKVYDNKELDRILSNGILTIELITNPGSNYDAEERSVLLIKTKNNEENGIAITLSQQLAYSKFPVAQEDIAVTYTYNNLSVFASYNNLYLKQRRNPHSIYTIHADTVWQQTQDVPQVYKYNTNNVSAGMDWSVSTTQAMGVQYQGNFSNDRVTSSGKFDISANDVLYDKISTGLFSKSKPRKHLVNAFYKGGFSNSFGLQLDMDYMNSRSKTNQKINEISSVEDREVTLSSQSDFELYASKLTMDYQLGEYAKLEFGGEYSYVDGSGFLLNPEHYIQENVYTNKEEKAAGFAMYSNQFGQWNFRIGIRYEYVHSRSTEDNADNVITNRTDHGFYPDISFSGKAGNTQMGVSVSRKTMRPSFDMLNSNNYYANRFLIQKGNPYLKNEDIYQADYHLTYQSFDFSVGYIYKKDPVAFCMESAGSNTSQTIMTYTNYNRYQEVNMLLNYRFDYKLWQSRLSAGIKKPFFHIDYLDEKLKRNKTSFHFDFYNDFLFPKNYIFSVNYAYQSKYNEYAWEHNSYHVLNLGLRKSFFHDSLTVNLQGEDIFNWITDRTVMKVNTISYIQKSSYDTRYIILTVGYRLNNYQKKYRGKNAAQDEIRRM